MAVDDQVFRAACEQKIKEIITKAQCCHQGKGPNLTIHPIANQEAQAPLKVIQNPYERLDNETISNPYQ
jgi:hypothetical protein